MAGTIDRRLPLLKPLLWSTVVLGACIWAAYVLAQQVVYNHRVAAEVDRLRQQNELIAAQNDAYVRELAAIESGELKEEDARMNGYALPTEKVFVIRQAPGQ